MKKILIGFLLASISSFLLAAPKEPKGVIYDTQIVRVSDGDTVVISAPFLPQPLKQELAVRIFGVDTPEKGHRAQCDHEAKMGELASAFTKQKVSQSTTRQVFLIGWDKFGGRVLGDIILDGRSLRKMLINEGLAREYYGEKKQSWC